jgi:hypothetical protein
MIPNGLQPHVLWNMDGRQWIENVHACGGNSLERALKRGWAVMIPQELLVEMVSKIEVKP